MFYAQVVVVQKVRILGCVPVYKHMQLDRVCTALIGPNRRSRALSPGRHHVSLFKWLCGCERVAVTSMRCI
jgi:hypothetical protein